MNPKVLSVRKMVDEHANLREKHEDATPAMQQAVKSAPD